MEALNVCKNDEMKYFKPHQPTSGTPEYSDWSENLMNTCVDVQKRMIDHLIVNSNTGTEVNKMKVYVI